MQIDPRWSIGNIVSLIALLSTILSVGAIWGTTNARLEKLESGYNQAAMDSRTLIELRKDVAYIRDSIQRIERATNVASSPIAICPTDRPVLVASYCRSYPKLD